MKNILLFCLLLTNACAFAQAPNFVFVLADDMGWTGTSVQIHPDYIASASDFYETPNLEALAASGMTFSSAYAPAPKCSPTRCSILTGQSTARNGFTETGNQGPTDEVLLAGITINQIPSNDLTIGEWLQSAGLGYRTAHFGKWHLGNGGTEDHGFDSGDGETSNGDGDAGDGGLLQDDPKLINTLTDRGISFMQEAVAADEPFYLQLSHYAVHTAVQTTEETFGYYDDKMPGDAHDNVGYGGMTQDLDAAIGRLLAEVEALGIAENTYIIFLSDNGAQQNLSNNAPLNRGKSFITEGGIRVPMIVRGPGITAGSHSFEPVVGYDLYPTVAKLTGSTTPLPEDLDGQDISSLFFNTEFDRSQPLYFHSPHYLNQAKDPESVALIGNFKYFANFETGEDFLYNLDVDISEANNLAADSVAFTRRLKVGLRDYLKTVEANMPTVNPAHPNNTGSGNDLDEDGLDDTWELRELLTIAYDGTDDPDGDGVDNEAEETEETDPLTDNFTTAIGDYTPFRDNVNISILPNPAAEVFTVELRDYATGVADLRIEMYGPRGRLIKQMPTLVNGQVNSLQGLRNGAYTIMVFDGDSVIGAKRLIVNR